jgi:hypothetical protein
LFFSIHRITLYLGSYQLEEIFTFVKIDRTASFETSRLQPVVGDWDGTGKDKIRRKILSVPYSRWKKTRVLKRHVGLHEKEC